VDGAYRFVACGEAPTTVNPPYREATEGLRHAIAEVQTVTGRTLFDDGAQLIMPSTTDGQGVDAVVATTSAGPAVRAVLVGLLPNVSLESVRHLAQSNYITVKDTFSLGDARLEAERIDAVIAANPNVIIIAGGTDGGATEALSKMLESVSLACNFIPPEQHLRVLYVGNTALREKVGELFSGVTTVYNADNVVPALGVENTLAARETLGQIFEAIRQEQLGGLTNIVTWANGRVFPTAQAQSEVIKFFSHAVGAGRGVLSVDVGSASTTIIAGFGDEVNLHVRPDVGIGVNATALLQEMPLERILRWIPAELTSADLRDFIYTKAAHPETIPADTADSYLEYALVRTALASALRRARRDWPRNAKGPRIGLMPWFEFVFGGGAALAHAPKATIAAMLMLDALEPVGITDFLLDPYHLAPALGALAHIHPTAVVQIIDSGAFLSLGTTVSLIGGGRIGETLMTAVLQGPADETRLDIKAGALEFLDLPFNQSGKLTLKPRPGIDIGMGPGRGVKNREVVGGLAGLIIDARSRPIAFPPDPAKRRELVQSWLWKAGAE